MPVHALALRRDVALEKLHKYFASEEAQARAMTMSAECPHCGVRFSIVLVDKNDAGNPDYCNFLHRLITLGCNFGRHEEVYELRE